MKSIIKNAVLLFAVAAAVFTGCKEDEEKVVNPTFSPDIVSVEEGSTTRSSILTGTEPFIVQSSSEAIASASVSGKTVTITGKTAGVANITVTGKDGGSGN